MKIPTQGGGRKQRESRPTEKDAPVEGESGFLGWIGFAETDITPPVGIRLKNWGAAVHETATGVHRALEGYAVTFQEERDSPPLVLVALDLGWWRSPRHEREVRFEVLRRLGLPEERLLLHLTHTHSGPSLNPDESFLPGGDLVFEYLALLPGRIVDLVQAALRTAEFGLLDWAWGVCTMARDRNVRSDDGESMLVGVGRDHRATPVHVGRVTDVMGQIRFSLVHYACHPTVLGPGNSLLSPDYPGAARELVREKTGAPCVFLQGMSGDLGPFRSFVSDPDVADQMGRAVGYAALSALSSELPPGTLLAKTGVLSSGAMLEMTEPSPAAPYRRVVAKKVDAYLPYKPKLSLDALEAQFHVAKEPGELERITRQIQYLGDTLDQLEALVSFVVWVIGDVAFLGVPGEMDFDENAHLAKVAASRTLLGLNVTNGWHGYFASRRDHAWKTYPAVQSPFYEMTIPTLRRHLEPSLSDLV